MLLSGVVPGGLGAVFHPASSSLNSVELLWDCGKVLACGRDHSEDSAGGVTSTARGTQLSWLISQGSLQDSRGFTTLPSS